MNSSHVVVTDNEYVFSSVSPNDVFLRVFSKQKINQIG